MMASDGYTPSRAACKNTDEQKLTHPAATVLYNIIHSASYSAVVSPLFDESKQCRKCEYGGPSQAGGNSATVPSWSASSTQMQMHMCMPHSLGVTGQEYPVAPLPSPLLRCLAVRAAANHCCLASLCSESLTERHGGSLRTAMCLSPSLPLFHRICPSVLMYTLAWNNIHQSANESACQSFSPARTRIPPAVQPLPAAAPSPGSWRAAGE